MINFPETVKEKLDCIIGEMADSSESFVKNPGKDFIRNRKLSFETVVNLLLSMGGNSLCKELLEYFSYDANTATSSAFIQQRDKNLPSAFEFLLHKFTDSFDDFNTYNGYRLLAVDGSNLNIACNSEDADTYCQSNAGSKGYNQLHLNALYDLHNKLYIDAIVQPLRKENEDRAFADMVDRSKISGNVIVTADRGYESYNAFAHLEQKGWKYVIRVKDVTSNGILSGLDLPAVDEFDEQVNLTLTRKQTNEVKHNPSIYRRLSNDCNFDFLDLKKNIYYPIPFRVLRFKISDDTYETIITNLESSEFSPEEIKTIYHCRWGIETSFRELKYAIGLTCFHAKKVEYITQEIFARLTMYNFCEIITLSVIIEQKPTKHGYQVNFTVAIQICRYFFRCRGNTKPPDVNALIKKNILPVRNNRKNARKIKPKTVVSFVYRVA